MEGENNASPRPPSLESRSKLRGRETSTRSSSNPTLSIDVVPLEKVSEDDLDEDNDNSFDRMDDHEQIAGCFSPNEVHKPTMESMATALATCEIARLPDDLLSALLAWTGPLDACRAAAVSRAFHAAADADTIWSSFLPHDLPPLADGELPADPQTTKKQLFMRLSNSARPVLLTDALTSMWLDRDTAAKCYILSARKVCIMSDVMTRYCIPGDTPQYWHWIPLTDSRFSEAAELLEVSWLDIRGKIHCNMLSQNTTYAVCLVFKMSDESFGMERDYPLQVARVMIGAIKSGRLVCLGCGVHHPQRRADRSLLEIGEFRYEEGVDRLVDVQHPQARADGWMEMELGVFKNEEGDDGEVSISLKDIMINSWKKGLIVQGIEIRVKK